MTRVIAISGVHGCGKSTFIADLQRRLQCQLFERSPFRNLDDVFARMVGRLAAHIADARAQRYAAEESGTGILLADRCALDVLAYVQTFRSLAVLTAVEHASFLAAIEALYTPELLPDGILFLRPELSWVQERIAERQAESGPKWKEEVPGFLAAAYDSFDSVFLHGSSTIGMPSMTTIDVTGSEKRCEAAAAWLREMRWLP